MNLKRILFTWIVIASALLAAGQQKYAIVIHGGAGVMSKEKISTEQQIEFKAKLNEALELGEKMLKQGADATDVVVKVINVLEDSPLFNAGKGAVFTHDEKVELDASIMEGLTLNAGAVAGVQDIKNPINAALEVMQHSEHVFLSGTGATGAESQNHTHSVTVTGGGATTSGAESQNHTHTVTVSAGGAGTTGGGGTGATGGVSATHTHDVTVTGGGGGTSGASGTGNTGSSGAHTHTTTGATASGGGVATTSAGGGTAHNIRSAYIAINVWQRTA